MPFWKSERSFDIDTLIRAPVDEVRTMLGDPHRWIGLQPLVVGAVAEPARPGFYRITERLKLAGIPVQHAYRARIAPHADGVDSEAWSVPFIHVDNRLRWVAEGATTRLRETSHLEGPAPLMGFVLATARRAHLTMLERIRDEIERQARP